MPKLFLLRHAEASASLVTNDIERTLTSRGIDQSKAIGQYLSNNFDPIDLALCSISKRTQMTLLTLQVAGLTIRKTEILEKLYNAPAEEIFNHINEITDMNILVVAHNPGIHELARFLVGEGTKEQIEKLTYFYSPGTLSVVECDIESWAALKPKQNTLEDIFIPD